LEHDILGGYDLSADYDEMNNHLLVAVTELNTKEEIDFFVETLKEVTND
jgi:glycine dehydrogenase subunit 1